MNDDSVDLLPLLDELRVMAQAGLFFADDPYDRERYERILELVGEYYGMTLDVPPEEIHDRLARDLGYVTPNVGVKAAIFDDEGRMLLMQRPEGSEYVAGTWDIPGGAVEPLEPPAETAIRETREETGLAVETIEVVDAYMMEPNRLNPHGHVLLLYLCEVTGGTLGLSHEGDALDYWEIEDVPAWTLDFRGPALDARDRWSEQQRDGREGDD
ncbi:NUDIX hydrolase N-terminal domain-containing protein [Halococcus dombrowskii]|uniref:NUDIX hydrolase n=1 Tax=Halococcus dombrowskii TaxID=179637 RepID=A0AAV3SKJ8_HALDO|nr:NUDIX hydrolase N-terminal domain-containing protein [Halococcus dombrowskii]UOO93806.1 NUDIX hydrolase N-terminal domain-containing protein [Halococcus dombrowskii]